MSKRKSRSQRATKQVESAPTEPATFRWDLPAYEAWALQHGRPCPLCGERLDFAKPEAALTHLLAHDHATEARATLEQGLVTLRNWDDLSEAKRAELLAPSIARLRNDPKRFEELQRAGVVARVGGKG